MKRIVCIVCLLAPLLCACSIEEQTPTIPEGDYDTISGYLVEELGRIPSEKEKPIIETPNVVYKVEKTKDMRITKIKACKVEILPDEDEEQESEE